MVAIDSPSLGGDLSQPSIRPYAGSDHKWAQQLLDRTGGRYRVRRGKVVDTAVLPGLVGSRSGVDSALVTFVRHKTNFEIVAIASDPFDSELVDLMIRASLQYRNQDCRRAYSICSNADFRVQRALQTSGFRLCTTRPGLIEAVARRSPHPLTRSFDGLDVRDEVEFDLLLI